MLVDRSLFFENYLPDTLCREFALNKFNIFNCMGSRVLDVGCGNGYFTTRFSNAIGVDVDKFNIFSAKRLLKHLDFILCDAEHLPFKDKSFSGIVAMEIIEHVENPIQLFSEAHRCLEHKGKFLLVFDIFSFGLAYASFCLKILLRDLGHKHTILSDKRDYVFVYEELVFKSLEQHFSLEMKNYCRGFVINFLVLLTNFILSTIYITQDPRKQSTKDKVIPTLFTIKHFAKFTNPLLKKLAKSDYVKMDASCLIALFERK